MSNPIGQDLSAKALIEKFDEALDKHDTSIGLVPSIFNDEVTPLLHMRREDISKLSADQCGENSYLLRQFGLHLQKSFNKEVAKVNWLDKKITEVICNEIGQYHAATADER